MTKRIGAEIFGLDLTAPLGNQALSEIHDALMAHQVTFFRDQELDHESHKRFGRAFGRLAIHSGVVGLPDHKEIVATHADASSRYVAGDEGLPRSADRAPRRQPCLSGDLPRSLQGLSLQPRPVIRAHPVTRRKGLYVNASYTTRIVELEKTESEAVLGYLYQHVKDPNLHVRFAGARIRWRSGTIAALGISLSGTVSPSRARDIA